MKANVLTWLQAKRRTWEDSFDKDRILEQSHPRSLLVVLAVGLTCILVPAYVEPVASAAGMDRVWLPVAAYLLGVLASATFWKLGGRGWAGLASTFLDTALLVTSVALCVAASNPPISYGYAALFGLMLASVQAREYALTLPFALACTLPTALVVGLVGVTPMEGLLLAIGCVVALWLSYNTRRVRAIERQRDRLVSALEVSDAVADAAVDVGLAELLLNIGHFMHELRNAQSTVEVNLQYLQETGLDGGQQLEALRDVIEGHRRATSLTYGVIEDLRSKGKAISQTFRLDETIRHNLESLGRDLRIEVEEPLEPLAVLGDPTDVNDVLTNLVRNAQQAGAQTVKLSARYEPARTAVRLRVADDGPGLPSDRIDSLFTPFFSLSEGGTGLGLYLCRKRLELMGGSIEAANLESGGAVFDIRLPATKLPENPKTLVEHAVR